MNSLNTDYKIIAVDKNNSICIINSYNCIACNTYFEIRL